MLGHAVLKSAVQGCGRRLDQSEFRPIAEVSFPVFVGPVNANEEGPLLAGNGFHKSNFQSQA